MNVLILVLSARREPWGELMRCQMETWDSEDHPQTKTLYYCGKSNQPSSEKVYYSPTLDESLESITSRTIEAFGYALTSSYRWDYLARPHSSTYVHKGNLVKFCEALPSMSVLCGIQTGGDRPFIWGGGHFLFSRDVIAKMVAIGYDWNHNIMDDNSISEMAKLLQVPVTPGRTATVNLQPDGTYLTLVYNHGANFTHTDFEGIGDKLDGHFFVRCKHDPDRSVDLRIMRELKEHWK